MRAKIALVGAIITVMLSSFISITWYVNDTNTVAPYYHVDTGQ